MSNEINQVSGMNSFSKKRRVQIGTVSALLVVVVILVTVFANGVFSWLCQNNSWYIDMTQEKVYGISDTSVELLRPLTETDIKIKFLFLRDKDVLSDSYYLNLIYQCMKNYQEQFPDLVSIEFIDMEANPKAVDKYLNTTATTLSKNSVIIENGADFRVFNYEAFFYADSETEEFIAFNGEYKITSCILQLTQKQTPIAYFSVGHGEKTQNTTLWNLFAEAGYETKEIDLSKEVPDTNGKVLIINGPTYDFIGAYQYGENEEKYKTEEGANEIAKLADFTDGQGNVMLFMDPDIMAKSDFTNLNEFLREWGIEFIQAKVKDSANAISVDGYSIVAAYETEGLGASITKSLRELGSIPKTVLREAAPIRILNDSSDGFSIDQSTRRISTILKSSADAESYYFDGTVTTGEQDLMVFVQDRIYIDNTPYETYLTVCGTSEFAAEKFIASNAYGNGDVLYALMKVMGKEVVPADIDLRLFEDYTLDVTTRQADIWTLVLTAAVPVISLAVGAVVYIRRKHL